jgi:tetratricopeptide (TPR) repeat protein
MRHAIKYMTLLLLLTGINKKLFSQKSYYDSLSNVLKRSLPDSVAFGVLMEIGNHLETENPDSAFYFHNKAMRIAERQQNDFMIGYVFKELGGDHYNLSEYTPAMDYYYKALNLAEKNLKRTNLSPNETIKFKKIKAATTGNIGVIYFNQGYYTRAIEAYYQAMKVNEELGRTALQAENLGNIGAVYYTQGDLAKAEEYFKKALQLNKLVDDKVSEAINLMNLGSVYFDQKNFDKALEFYFNAQKIDDELGGGTLTNNYCNIGSVYASLGDNTKALDYYTKALETNRKGNDRHGEAITLSDLGTIYMRQKKYKLAEKYFKESYAIAKDMNLLERLKKAHENFSDLYENSGQFALALDHFRLYIQYHDSIKNEETTRRTIQQEFKYNYEKRFAADSVIFAKEKEIREAEIAKQEAELKAKRNQQYALFGGMALVIVFSGFIYNRFKVTQKQKAIIEHQKDLVEEKQREILDSIRYAKRIQKSLLPTERYIQKNLKM